MRARVHVEMSAKMDTGVRVNPVLAEVFGAKEAAPARRPWAVLAIDVETHGWVDSPRRQSNHRGEFGKLRWGGVNDNLGFSRVVQLGFVSFANNGDVLDRQELCVRDAPPCQQRATDFHGLTDAVLVDRGLPMAEVLRQFASALRRLQQDGGLLVAHLMEYDAALLKREYQRIGAIDDAALLTSLATDGVCTMQAAAAQQRAVVFPPRTDEQLRNSFNYKLLSIKLAAACRMYRVAMPTESEGYHAHNAMYDAEVAGRLYFAMRGIAYRPA